MSPPACAGSASWHPAEATPAPRGPGTGSVGRCWACGSVLGAWVGTGAVGWHGVRGLAWGVWPGAGCVSGLVRSGVGCRCWWVLCGVRPVRYGAGLSHGFVARHAGSVRGLWLVPRVGGPVPGAWVGMGVCGPVWGACLVRSGPALVVAAGGRCVGSRRFRTGPSRVARKAAHVAPEPVSPPWPPLWPVSPSGLSPGVRRVGGPFFTAASASPPPRPVPRARCPAHRWAAPGAPVSRGRGGHPVRGGRAAFHRWCMAYERQGRQLSESSRWAPAARAPARTATSDSSSTSGSPSARIRM